MIYSANNGAMRKTINYHSNAQKAGKWTAASLITPVFWAISVRHKTATAQRSAPAT